MSNDTSKSRKPGERSSAAVDVGQGKRGEAESYNQNFEDDTPPSHDDSVLESIGKAITAPMRDAADEGSTEESDRKKP
jgi:hypothetical protein